MKPGFLTPLKTPTLTRTAVARPPKKWAKASILKKLPKIRPFALLLLLLTIVTLLGRFLTLPTFVESGDGLYFVRGLERYAMTEMRPHRPGFPVYLWLGHFFKLFTSNSEQALHLVGITSSSLTILPLAALAGAARQASGGNSGQVCCAALAAGFIWALIPLSWLVGSEIYSDSLALFLSLLMLWSCWRSLKYLFSEAPSPFLASKAHVGGWLILAGLVGGLLLGTRLSYAALLLPLIYATWLNRHLKVKWHNLTLLPLPWLVLVSFGAAVCSWLGWQWLMEGSAFFELLTAHFSDDYRIYDLTLSRDTPDLPTRLLVLSRVILVYGLGGWWSDVPWPRLLVSVTLVGPILTGSYRLLKAARQPVIKMLLLWLVPYLFITLTISHDLWMARYTFPLVALLTMVAAIGLPNRPNLSYGWSAAIVLSLCIVTLPLAWQHKDSPPLGQRLVEYVHNNLKSTNSFVLISTTTHQAAFLSLFMSEHAADFGSRSLYPALLAGQVEQLERQGRKAYLVWPTAAPSPGAGWTKVINLQQARFMDSVMDADNFLEISLYRHQVPSS